MRRHLALPAAVLVAVLPITAVGVAEADIQRFSDGRNDVNRTSDIHWVKIDNATSNPNKVKVVIEQDELAPDLADTLQVFINTRADHRGPEYRYTVAQDYFLTRMRSWTRPGRPVRGCQSFLGGPDYDRDRWNIAIPRDCIGNPGRVKVAVHLTRFYPHKRDTSDWAKDNRTFLPSVAR